MPEPPLQLREDANWRISPERLAAGLGIAAWDALLIGDGAGSGAWTMGIGHACVLYDRKTGAESIVWGGWSGGAVIMAELLAFLQGFWTFDKLYGHERLGTNPQAQHVVFLTDNQPIVAQSVDVRRGKPVSPDTMPIWAAIQAISRRGYSYELRWVPRLSLDRHTVADDLSRRTRVAVQNPELGANTLSIPPSIVLANAKSHPAK